VVLYTTDSDGCDLSDLVQGLQVSGIVCPVVEGPPQAHLQQNQLLSHRMLMPVRAVASERILVVSLFAD
jgi:hypothetical protein